MNGHERHNLYLENLVANLSRIGEDSRRVRWIMKDGIWLKEGTTERNTLCDLIICYQDLHACAVELKGSRNKKHKAVLQVESGALFAREVLGYNPVVKKVVFYSNRGYNYEVVP